MKKIDNLDRLGDDCQQFIVAELERGSNPLEIAATLVTQALTLYRNVLSDEDFEGIMDCISESRDRIPTLSTKVNLH